MRRPLPWVALLAAAMILLIPSIGAASDGTFAAYESRGWGWMFLGAFGFGFITSLTPCVYPMIPITLAIFGARGENVSKKKSILLASAYVGGMGVTYSVLGVTFAMIGKASDFGTQLASPWLVFPLVALFLALAASMFGAFDLNLPSAWQAKLNQIGGKGFGGAFAMGLVGGLIAAPCTGPFLAGLLAFVSTTGNPVGGAALLFVYALGMGVLFFVLAAASLALPKSGRWMDSVKSAGGIGLLFAAVYFLKPFLPFIRHSGSPALWFLAAGAIVTLLGFALGAIQLSFSGPWSERGRKAVGIALVLAGVTSMWMWKLSPKHRLPWVVDEQVAFEQARAQHKGVLVDFSATWCNPCEEMELTFGDDDVYAEINASFIPLKFDVTSSSDENFARRSRYSADTLPAVVFMSVDGSVLGRVNKMTEPDDMMQIVKPAAKKMRAGYQSSRQMQWIDDESAAFARARTEHKGVMIDFSAAWCNPCAELEVTLDKLGEEVNAGFVPLKFDVTQDSDRNTERRGRYAAQTLPAIVFAAVDGTVLARIGKTVAPDEMLSIVKPAAQKAHELALPTATP